MTRHECDEHSHNAVPLLPSLACIPLPHCSQELDLSHNVKLTGVLPEYWARLTNLRRLDVSNCSLSGRLPETWVALQSVVSLDLSSNMFSGDVPDSWAFMTASKYQLRCLNLAGNVGMTNVLKVRDDWQERSAVKVVVQPGAAAAAECR